MALRIAALFLLCLAAGSIAGAQPLAQTAPLEFDGDPGLAMVEGIHRWLDRATEAAPAGRAGFWDRDTASEEAYCASVAANRERFRACIGVADERTAPVAMEVVSVPGAAASSDARVRAVRWSVMPGVHGEGLYLLPESAPRAAVIVLPDCDWTPEQCAGLAAGLPPEAQCARRLVSAGCAVLVPCLIDREDTWSGNPAIRMTNQPHREFVYRAAFELGRHIIGYEVQKVLAGVDWLEGQGVGPIAVAGYGEGGLTAFYAAAADTRIDAAFVSGYFGPREAVAEEPIYRNVWRLLREFGDAEIASLVAPRPLIVEAATQPDVAGPPPERDGRRGAAPGRIVTPGVVEVRAEAARARALTQGLTESPWIHVFETKDGVPGAGEGLGTFVSALSEDGERDTPALEARLTPPTKVTRRSRLGLRQLAAAFGAGSKVPDSASITSFVSAPWRPEASFLSEGASTALGVWGQTPVAQRACAVQGALRAQGHGLLPVASRLALPDAAARMERQFAELVAETQKRMRDCDQARAEFWKEADGSSAAAWTASARPYRARFHEEVIGKLPDPDVPIRPRTRRFCETPAYTGYEVMLDVYPDVFAYGLLLLPKGMVDGERRPVVVGQHGLEGTPRKVADPETNIPAYGQFGCKLAEEGFIVYAPQNPYIGGNRFRQIVRKANPLGWSLFSFIVRQHERTLEWLKAQPFVDPERIAFYGISYGGKTALRVPAILEDYALSICSGDFNQWIWKICSIDAPFSYMFTHEYEMLEWNLGNTFNYGEMSWLIFPRPFMVERGHWDGVSWDEWVAYEYARSRRHYNHLGLGDKTAIEFFDGPHAIHGVGTFEFLREHLAWPVGARPAA